MDQLAGQVEVRLRRRKRQRRRVATSAAGAMGLAFALFWGVPYVRETDTVMTMAAQRQALDLNDGSRVELNARTDLRTDFRYGRRTVRLGQGEAFFSVAKDTKHPFLVETPAGTIRVTGTAFNVRLSPEGRTEVTLLEGSVTVNAAAALRPGQQLEFGSGEPSLRTLDGLALAAATAWRQSRLVLDALTLGEAADRLAEYHGVAIRVDPAVASLTPGGTYPLDDLGGFLEALETVLPVQVITRAPGDYLIGARQR